MTRIRSHGSPQELRSWLRQSRFVDGSVVELQLEDLGGGAPIASWSPHEIDAESWPDDTVEMVRSDADARGAGTYRYSLRHVVGDRVKSVKALRMVVKRAREDDDDDGPQLDGTMLSVFQQLQKSNDLKDRQLLELVKASTEAQKAAMALLGQAYQHIGTLQKRNAELHETTTQEVVTTSKHASDDDPFRVMLEAAAPHVVNRLAERLLGPDFFDDGGSGASTSSDDKLPQ